jgi:hypothetical protein
MHICLLSLLALRGHKPTDVRLVGLVQQCAKLLSSTGRIARMEENTTIMQRHSRRTAPTATVQKDGKGPTVLVRVP